MDKTKKTTYTPEEVGIRILEKVKNIYKKSDLYKANTAHEVENGQEPSTPDAECPEQLATGEVMKPDNSGDKKKKKVPECGSCGRNLKRTTFCGHKLEGCPHCKIYWERE